DLDLVEQLGSGVHRILKAYSKDVFKISENFLEICFPFKNEYFQVTDQVTDQVVSLLKNLGDEALSANEMMRKLSLHHKHTFRENYLQSAMEMGYVRMTIPDKPKSRLQRYTITQKG
nr:transcriptional regulator [Prolixibacteraceae bacterium]